MLPPCDAMFFVVDPCLDVRRSGGGKPSGAWRQQESVQIQRGDLSVVLSVV